MLTRDLLLGDCVEVLKGLADCSVDSIVTDPPYGLSFMGKKWDYDVPSEDVWRECLRVLKPGGHLLAFAGTRTQHRMAVRIEDAGFEIRDMIAWVYGSGFPKSYNLDGEHDGWGTALKPAMEPLTVARKPFRGTVAANVAEHGTGAINVDECRVAYQGDYRSTARSSGQVNSGGSFGGGVVEFDDAKAEAKGRWPANLIHDGSEEVVGLLGSAARFFYCAKASKRDRDEGCDHLPEHQEGLQLPRGKCPGCGTWKNAGEAQCKCGGQWEMTSNPPPKARNNHPTVKPTDLMRYLCRLVTPPGGIVLDPFMGSGSTGKAAMLEGFQFIGIERDEEYMKIAEARIKAQKCD
jgi:DNA modification methylase